MEVKRLRNLDLEIFKAINNMNVEYMKEIFHETTFPTHRPLNIVVNENHTTKYGKQSLRCLGPPSQVKFKKADHTKFKEFINDGFDRNCKCNLCSFLA